MTFVAFVFSVLMGVGSLIFAFTGTAYDLLVHPLLIFGIFWLYTGWRRWEWFSVLGFLLLVALAGFGLWNDLLAGWMIAAALGGLLAWDLSEFRRRLRLAPETEDLQGLENRHLARLTIVALLGLLFASSGMLVSREFTFEWVLLLILVAVLGVAQLVAWLRRSKR